MQHAEFATELPVNQGVQQFFDEMAKALTTGDSPTLSLLWEAPAFVVGDEGALVITSPQEIEEFFAGSKETYHERGVFDTRAEILSTDWATDRIVVVEVRWPWLDADGKE